MDDEEWATLTYHWRNSSRNVNGGWWECEECGQQVDIPDLHDRTCVHRRKVTK